MFNQWRIQVPVVTGWGEGVAGWGRGVVGAGVGGGIDHQQ